MGAVVVSYFEFLKFGALLPPLFIDDSIDFSSD
jgi:hypothetical protein